jgi:undecaprenyl diphosphate synthase
MDGNGRWAQRRSLPRTAGHRAAESTVIDIIEAARAAGVQWLSLYAFSTENWNRPGAEVDYLMRLVRRVVRKHAPLLLARDIRCRFLGVTDPRIPRELAQDFDDLAVLTADNRGMTLTRRAPGHRRGRTSADPQQDTRRRGHRAALRGPPALPRHPRCGPRHPHLR